MRRAGFWKSFACAGAGLWHVVRSERNAKIELGIAAAAVALGSYLQLGPLQWAVVVLTIGSVLAAEIGNTVVERLVDLVSPEEHALARVAKDAAAGGVLLTAVASIVVGLLIFGPPLYRDLFGS